MPWQPALDRRIGQHITGVVRDSGGIEWGFGKNGDWGYERRSAERDAPIVSASVLVWSDLGCTIMLPFYVAGRHCYL